MKDKLQALFWKVCIVVLGVLLVSQVGILFSNLQQPEQEEVLHFQAPGIAEQKNDAVIEHDSKNSAEPTPTPFILTNFDRIRVVITNKANGSVYHDNREAINPMEYRGDMEVVETAEGYVFINDLPLEEYLYSVVPSEMPSGYPMEALKAQAICARTYAYLHILSPGYPQWNAHVDDTTTYQVYHNVTEQESTTRAVQETQGMVLLAPNRTGLAQTYYYSTSCGYGSDAHVWRTKFADQYPYLHAKALNKQAIKPEDGGQDADFVETMAGGRTENQAFLYTSESLRQEEVFTDYIKNVNPQDWEAEENWYRWQYHVENVDTDRMLKMLQNRYAANKDLILTLDGSKYVSKPINELDVLVDLVIDKRGAGGVADELLIITDKNVYKVITELNIRYVLNDGKTMVKRNDDTEVVMNTLLPSAFFVLENCYENGKVKGYEITGGGFGHGAGMSQNAAKAMALDGMTAEEILRFFYEGCSLEKAVREENKE